MGIKKKEWNPKMLPFLFHSYMKKNKKYHFIDVRETRKYLIQASNYLRFASAKKKVIAFIGSKQRYRRLIRSQARKCGAFYINYRWLGGMLTNWKVIKKRIHRLKVLETFHSYGIINYYPKKESARLKRELIKLKNYLCGIKNMPYLPDVVVILHQKYEMNAIKECKKLQIPIISINDTNCDPDLTHIGIPGNDDSRKSLKFILKRLVWSIKNPPQLKSNQTL